MTSQEKFITFIDLYASCSKIAKRVETILKRDGTDAALKHVRKCVKKGTILRTKEEFLINYAKQHLTDGDTNGLSA